MNAFMSETDCKPGVAKAKRGDVILWSKDFTLERHGITLCLAMPSFDSKRFRFSAVVLRLVLFLVTGLPMAMIAAEPPSTVSRRFA
jgi:hypothetical protein